MVGEHSSIGRIQALITTDIETTPLQQKLEKIARTIGMLGLGASILTIIILLIRFFIFMGIHNDWNEGYRYKDLVQYFLTAVRYSNDLLLIMIDCYSCCSNSRRSSSRSYFSSCIFC